MTLPDAVRVELCDVTPYFRDKEETQFSVAVVRVKFPNRLQQFKLKTFNRWTAAWLQRQLETKFPRPVVTLRWNQHDVIYSYLTETPKPTAAIRLVK
jgi:hypothetical protein